MINYLKGNIIDYTSNSVTFLTNSGIGFEVFCPSDIIQKIETNDNYLKESTSLYVSTIIKENDISLYGFLTKQQKNLFNTIISVNGIGPKIALEILSNIDPVAFVSAISTSDINKLTKIKGIGRKGAEKIIFSLKDKMSKEKATEAKPIDTKYDDLVKSLIYMGYKDNEAEKIANNTYDKSLPIEDLIKKALSHT